MTDTHHDRDDENRGDNPGVGGIPADGEIEHGDPSDDADLDDDENRGDNPGVGGLPDDKHGR